MPMLPRALAALSVLVLAACGQNHETTAAEPAVAQGETAQSSWASTIDQHQRHDLLAERPALVALYAGSPYAWDFQSPRGHHYAVADAARSPRTFAPSEDKAGTTAACWSCKTPTAYQQMNALGEEGFAKQAFTDVGPEVSVSIGCADCHQEGNNGLALPRPFAQKAMAKIHLPFDEQDASMQGSQVCGQCHVTYYPQPEADNKINIPWIFGSTADAIEKYYDTRRFYDFMHPISGTPIVKARHPEFETWSRSVHAGKGVGCVECHMSSKTNAQGQTYRDHNVSGALADFDTACAECHDSQAAMTERLADNKARIDTARAEVEDLLVKAHWEAKAAWDAGANWDQMNAPIMDIRHAQWRWDFATVSHGIHAHNPGEAKDLLFIAQRQANMARARLASILETLEVTEVAYPDLSSKASAQAAIDLDLTTLQQAKNAFIQEEIAPHWQPVANRITKE